MDDCTFIIFGATGDLAQRKLFPALYKLLADKKLKNFLIIGAARDDVVVSDLLVRAQPFIKNLNEEVWEQFAKRTHYHKIEFTQEEDFASLEQFVSSLEKKQNLSGNRLLYLAASSDFFCNITKNSVASGLAKKISGHDDRPWYRLVYEKPFGHDFESAHEINICIREHVDEVQVYRVDHYLTKEIVSNIAMIRFSNCVFEPLWNNRFVDSVQIILSEKVCVEGRGTYYDNYGVLRDIVQNHALELLALVAMEAPDNLVGEAVREKRARVLERVKVVDGLFGQYENYTKEKGVAQGSRTETFASLLLRVENERWSGVPFYIKAGKCLQQKETTIYIKFKQVDCLLTKGCPMESNHLKIQIDPKSIFALNLNAKKPGTTDELMPVEMEFCHSCQFEALTPHAYEVIFQQVMQGETAISVRFDEIESAWRVIDHVYSMNFPLYRYGRDSGGPEEDSTFAQKHGMRWLS